MINLTSCLECSSPNANLRRVHPGRRVVSISNPFDRSIARQRDTVRWIVKKERKKKNQRWRTAYVIGKSRCAFKTVYFSGAKVRMEIRRTSPITPVTMLAPPPLPRQCPMLIPATLQFHKKGRNIWSRCVRPRGPRTRSGRVIVRGRNRRAAGRFWPCILQRDGPA